MSEQEPKSEFAIAIEERFAKRTAHDFDVDGYFGLGATPIPKVAIRVPTAREQVAAIDQAYTLVKKMGTQEETRTDSDVLSDLKMSCLAFWAARNPRDHRYSAFPGPEWMYANMTNDQIGAIVALANTVKRRDSPTPVEISDDTIESIAVALSAGAGTARADSIMAGIVDRDALNYITIALADKLMTARADLVAYVKEQQIAADVQAIGPATIGPDDGERLPIGDEPDGQSVPLPMDDEQ